MKITPTYLPDGTGILCKCSHPEHPYAGLWAQVYYSAEKVTYPFGHHPDIEKSKRFSFDRLLSMGQPRNEYRYRCENCDESVWRLKKK